MRESFSPRETQVMMASLVAQDWQDPKDHQDQLVLLELKETGDQMEPQESQEGKDQREKRWALQSIAGYFLTELKKLQNLLAYLWERITQCKNLLFLWLNNSCKDFFCAQICTSFHGQLHYE